MTGTNLCPQWMMFRRDKCSRLYLLIINKMKWQNLIILFCKGYSMYLKIHLMKMHENTRKYAKKELIQAVRGDKQRLKMFPRV